MLLNVSPLLYVIPFIITLPAFAGETSIVNLSCIGLNNEKYVFEKPDILYEPKHLLLLQT